jgi:hypothetical protein
MWCKLKKKEKENEGVGVTIYRMWLVSSEISLKKLVVNKFISFVYVAGHKKHLECKKY